MRSCPSVHLTVHPIVPCYFRRTILSLSSFSFFFHVMKALMDCSSLFSSSPNFIPFRTWYVAFLLFESYTGLTDRWTDRRMERRNEKDEWSDTTFYRDTASKNSYLFPSKIVQDRTDGQLDEPMDEPSDE